MMKFNQINNDNFEAAKVLIIFIVCLVLLVSIIPFLAMIVEPEGNRADTSLYHSYEELRIEILGMEENYSSIMKVYNLTTTFEKRTVWAVKISDGVETELEYDDDSEEPGILFMAGQKANSNISVEIAITLLNYLVSNYGVDDQVTELVNNREIWILPMVNPDGHEYVGQGHGDWVKNRRNNGDGTYGVNLDRNYGFNWGIDDYTSDNTISQYYHGEHAFSEPETQAVRNLVAGDISQDFNLALSFSSSGETITYPWGYTNITDPNNLLVEIANDMSMYNRYYVKQSSELYINHGNADDWLYDASILPFTLLTGNEDIPEENYIDTIVDENIPVCLYLLDVADNPNRALKAEWTFLVYMSGDNDLEQWGIADINEMEMVGSNPYLNIVVQFDRASDGDITNGNWDETRRYLVLKDYDIDIINSRLLMDIGEVNMGDPQILLEFVNWSISNYPAKRYFLDMWGHGSGFLGVSKDGSDWLTMTEIKSVLPKFKDKIDVLGFDNCNMAMIEVYTQFVGHIDYIVGSEKEEDALGWPYDMIFKDLSANPKMSPFELSSIIPSHYVEWARNNSTYSATVSVVDMAYLPKLINKTDELAKELNWTLPLYFDEIDYSIKNTEKYGKPPNPRDLYNFTELIQKKVPNNPIKIVSESVMEGIENLVYVEEHLTKDTDMSVDNAHGIAVWLYDGNYYSQYENLDFSKVTFWDEFLAAYKAPPPKPKVDFELEDYTLSDSDSEGDDDTINLRYKTNTTGLNITLKVYNNENEHITTFYLNNTVQGEGHMFSFNPMEYNYPSDYYNFYAYLINDENILQNYSEVTDIWLGNEKPEIILSNLTFYRKDLVQVGGDTGKSPIEGENIRINVSVENNGTIKLKDVKIEFFENNELITTEELDLELQEERILTVHFLGKVGEKAIKVVADKENLIKEIDESNNEIIEVIEIKPNIPTTPLILTGKVRNKDNIIIIGANVQIRNIRTNGTINETTNENGYEVELQPEWFLEGDMIDIKAEYNSVSSNVTVYAYSDDVKAYANITLDTEIYDAIFYFKLGLIVFEIIGFILVIKYYIGMKRHKGGEGKT